MVLLKEMVGIVKAIDRIECPDGVSIELSAHDIADGRIKVSVTFPTPQPGDDGWLPQPIVSLSWIDYVFGQMELAAGMDCVDAGESGPGSERSGYWIEFRA